MSSGELQVRVPRFWCLLRLGQTLWNGWTADEFGTEHYLGLLQQEAFKFWRRDGRLVPYLLVVTFDFLFELGNVFGVEKLVGRRVLEHTFWSLVLFSSHLFSPLLSDWRRLYLSKLCITQRKRIHEGLGNDGEAAVQVGRLLHVEHKLRVLDDVHPVAQW